MAANSCLLPRQANLPYVDGDQSGYNPLPTLGSRLPLSIKRGTGEIRYIDNSRTPPIRDEKKEAKKKEIKPHEGSIVIAKN